MPPQAQALVMSLKQQLQQQGMQMQAMGQALQEKQSELALKGADIAVKQDKVDKDYEVKMLQIAETIGANIISYIQSDLQQVREHEMQKQAQVQAQQQAPGNGAA